jgi:hypothetical protein
LNARALGIALRTLPGSIVEGPIYKAAMKRAAEARATNAPPGRARTG